MLLMRMLLAAYLVALASMAVIAGSILLVLGGIANNDPPLIVAGVVLGSFLIFLVALINSRIDKETRKEAKNFHLQHNGP